MTLVLVAVLALTGVALAVGYRPPPDDPVVVRTVHRLASALLLPASWVLLAALVLERTGRGADEGPSGRRGGGRGVRTWVVPALLVLAVPAAAFTGFLLPWERVFAATAVVPPDLSGLAPAFDASIAAVSFGGAPVERAVFQRYALAHLVLGAGVTVLAVLIVRGGGRTTPGRGRPRSRRGPAPGPRTTA